MKLSGSTGAIFANLRVLIGPLAILAFLGLLFIFVLRAGINQVLTLRKSLNDSKAEEKVLSQKLNVLEVSEDSALPLADLSLIALPYRNPSLTIISQLRKLAGEKAVTISDIQAKGARAEEEAALSTTEIELTISGEVASIFDFLKVLKTTSPLTTIDEIKMDSEVDLARTEVKIVGQFAPLPTTLPTIETPLNELTAEERDILAKISTYSAPIFSEVPPSGPYERVDLFNF